MAESDDLQPLAANPRLERLFYCLFSAYAVLAGASVLLIAWFHAGLGAGKWLRPADSAGYAFSAGSWHVQLPAYFIYWPGAIVVLAVVAGYVVIGWLALQWYRREYCGAEAGFRYGAMRWPLIHSVLLTVVLWRYLAQIAAQTNDLTFGLYGGLCALSAVLLALAFIFALGLHRLFGWSLVFWYVVLVLVLPSDVWITVS